ncbi:MAG: ChbG/HpnK family deacetylase [Burkholderiaceae bacterium]|nr:MAG: ChbG/HpnK family deacetylase [Burkholderiaceae bacterium]
MKPLVLCADDFAVHAGASRGIAQLARQGRLSATSAMVLSPRWPQDVALLQELRGRIDVGLHLDWTSEFAQAAGHGLPLGAAMRRSLLGGFDRAAAQGVIERQLDLFEAQWQAPPDHVDGHQHVQQFAGIREPLVELLAHRYPGRLPYLRVSQVRAGTGERLGFKSRVISALGANAIEKIADSAGMQMAKALLGVYDFEGDAARYAALMDGWLAGAPAGGLLMCHPAQAAERGDGIGAARQREYGYLASAEFAAALARAQVMLVRGAVAYRQYTRRHAAYRID